MNTLSMVSAQFPICLFIGLDGADVESPLPELKPHDRVFAAQIFDEVAGCVVIGRTMQKLLELAPDRRLKEIEWRADPVRGRLFGLFI